MSAMGAPRNAVPGAAPRALGLLFAGCSAPPPAHQINVGPRLEERIGGGFDAVHSRDRIEDDVLLLAGVVRDDLAQTELAECALRTILGPAQGGIVNDVADLCQLYSDT